MLYGSVSSVDQNIPGEHGMASPRRPQNYFFLLKFVLWVYCHSVWETVVNVIEIDVRFQVQCSAFFIECPIIHIYMNLDGVEYLNDMNTL